MGRGTLIGIREISVCPGFPQEALIGAMQSKQLATVSILPNGAKEVFFKPEAVGLVLSFFK